MLIGVDAREIQNGVTTGIGRSLSNFITYFGKNQKKHELVLFSEKRIPLKFNFSPHQIVINKRPTICWDQWRLPVSLKLNKIDLFYSPYYKIPLFSNIPTVSQILDLMFIIHPEYKSDLNTIQKFYYAVIGKAFAKKSLSIITDSEHAKNDIIKQWKINPQKIIVIPLGLADRYKPVNDRELLNKIKKNMKLPEKFILYLGNFKPHKNVNALIEAYKKIENKFPEHKLVLAGPLDDHGIKTQDYVSRLGLTTKILFTDTVRESDYPEAIITMADLFVFPSLYEGFGLPPLEAMACGTPVLASNLTSVPEVVADAGVLVNPKNIEDLANGMLNILKSSETRAIYSNKGLERAKKFREKYSAGKLYNHIISLLEEVK